MAAIFRIFFMTILSLSCLMMLSLVISSFGGKVDYYTESLKALKERISSMVDDLIPTDIHEIKILCWTAKSQKTKKGITFGYFSTIFQEKMIAYAMQGNETETMLHAETTKQDYTLHKEGRSTKVFLSEKLIGTIKAYKGFYELEAGKEFYKAIHSGTNSYSIREKDIEVADIVLGTDESSNDRLFKMIDKPEYLENDSFIAFLLYLLLLKS